MSDQITHTAILFFSRSSDQEALAKSFLPSKFQSRNKDVAQELIDRSAQQLKATRLPFFVWNEQLQHGSTFGEKLAGAVDAIFQKGFQKVLVLGNDCLALTSQQIKRAALSLDCNDAVLASTKKGGVYLIGLTKKTFNKKNFIDIRWQTSLTYQDLLTSMAGQHICKLPLKDDVNDYADLRQQINLLLRNNPVRILVENMLTLSQSFDFRFHKLDYNFKEAKKRMIENQLSISYANTLETGIWDNCEILPEEETRRQGMKLIL